MAPAQAQKPLQVGYVEFILETYQTRVKAGERIDFLAHLEEYAGVPVTGETVKLYYLDPETGEWKYLAENVTDPLGMAPFTVEARYEWGCKTVKFKALAEAYGLESNTVSVEVALPTEISLEAPTSVKAGQTFTVKGKLYKWVTKTRKEPLAGKKVFVSVAGQSVLATTAEDGSFSATFRIDRPGEYGITATFKGEPGLAAVSFIPGGTVSVLPFIAVLSLAYLALKALWRR